MNKVRNQSGSIGTIVLIVVLIGVIVAIVFGYMFFSNPKEFLVDRKIESDTSHEESLKDKVTPRTEIKESGYNLEVIIKPSDNNVISDTVTITATQVVEEAAGVGFFLSETKEALTSGGMDSLGIDRSTEGGWSNTFNTTEIDNGKYYINVVVYSSDGDGPPLGAAQIPVEIKN